MGAHGSGAGWRWRASSRVADELGLYVWPEEEEAYSAVVQGTSFPCFTSTNGETLTGEEVEAFSGACLSAGLAAWHQVSHSSEAEERLKRGLSSA